MASTERDYDANGSTRGDSSGPGEGKEDAEDKSGLEPQKKEKYLVADPMTGEGHCGPFKYISDLLIDKTRWRQSCQISEPVVKTVEAHETWQARISLLILKLLWFVNKPYMDFGHWIEDMINHFQANGGVMKTFYRTLLKRNELVTRLRLSEDYVTLAGALDPRFTLYLDRSRSGVEGNDDAEGSKFPGTNYGSRETADLLVMASKLAYENENYVRKVVNTTWKMNFVAFYNCWNEFQQQTNTQVFLFTDKPKNAGAIVVAFRGTELFNAIDWATDMDFSWFVLKELGIVHVGFLEALGLGDRKRMETFVVMRDNASYQQHEGSAMSGLPSDVLLEPEKTLAYDEVTKKVKQLMEENPEAKLFVTGHSLGGALANLYTTLLFFNSEMVVTSRLGALYTFGQPRVGGEDYSKFMISKIRESNYWRVVYGNDLVPRVPFDDDIFQFKHAGYCYYYNARYAEMTLEDAPNANYFSLSLKNILMQRLVALYELFVSLFSGWIYGSEFRVNYASLLVRLLGVFIAPGITAHLINNYVNAIRLGPTPLEAKLSEGQSTSLFPFIPSFMRRKEVPATKDAHKD